MTSNLDDKSVIHPQLKDLEAQFEARSEAVKKTAPPLIPALPEWKRKTPGWVSERMAKHSLNFKYNAILGWVSWSGKHWIKRENEKLNPDFANAVRAEIKAMAFEAEVLKQDAAILKSQLDDLEPDPKAKQTISHLNKEAKELKKLAESLDRATGLREVASYSAIMPEFQTDLEDFDKNTYLFNCQNGTLNLKTGLLQPHRRQDYITKMIQTEYKSDASCPRWERFLTEIMCNDLELVTYLQRIIGICLTGQTKEHSFYVLYGSGRNGKSVFMTTIQALLGDYAHETSAEILLENKTNPHGPSDGLASLAGVRLVTANESEKNRRLAEATVKQMTGGDKIRARHLYKPSFEFKPEFKLFLRTNHKPQVSGTDDGIWSRIKLIPFEAFFPPGQSDPNLSETLLSELPGILAWAVNGYLDYLRNGLSVPSKVKAATDEYRLEQDSLNEFLMSEIQPNIKFGDMIKASELIEKYSDWAIINERRRMSSREIAAKLEKAGWSTRRTEHGIFRQPPPSFFKTLSYSHPTAI